ncbi:alpha/beta hydrolase [Streptomyces sp. NPDC055954]|uniref:alpha/beta hydrolase n=1 Tax=Streptomyces sp. NPDC055954 TaxID=3345664 RepID=UPI0035DE84BF
MRDQPGCRRGVLLTYEGRGHGSVTSGSCMEDAVDGYLTGPTLPARGTRCPPRCPENRSGRTRATGPVALLGPAGPAHPPRRTASATVRERPVPGVPGAGRMGDRAAVPCRPVTRAGPWSHDVPEARHTVRRSHAWISADAAPGWHGHPDQRSRPGPGHAPYG